MCVCASNEWESYQTSEKYHRRALRVTSGFSKVFRKQDVQRACVQVSRDRHKRGFCALTFFFEITKIPMRTYTFKRLSPARISTPPTIKRLPLAQLISGLVRITQSMYCILLNYAATEDAPVLGLGRTGAVLQQELNAVVVTFGCCQVQSSSPVVVALAHVHPAQMVPAQSFLK